MINKYAKIENNVVINTIMCNDSTISEIDGNHVKVTDLTNDAHVGYTYNSEKNKFTDIQAYDSWVLNSETLLWESPIGPKPTDTFYRWDEESTSWKKLSE